MAYYIRIYIGVINDPKFNAINHLLYKVGGMKSYFSELNLPIMQLA